jgi:DNA-binding MarR family transcriptional regulator
MTQTPTLTGQDIGLAHYATRALLERSLAENGTSWIDWLAINAVATGGPVVEQATVVQRLTGGLKIEPAEAQSVIDGVIDSGVVARAADDPSHLELTPAGEALAGRVLPEIRRLTELIYGDLPPEDLAAAHRVLAIVQERANAALTA